MSDRIFSHYHANVSAGPGMVAIDVMVNYYDTNGEFMGNYGEHLIAFATTWKDVATVVRTGLRLLGLDEDPVRNVSPMVDLS
jgi:hypothetical protein